MRWPRDLPAKVVSLNSLPLSPTVTTMLKNNGVLIVSLVALVLALGAAMVWLKSHHGAQQPVSSAAALASPSAAAGAAAELAPLSDGQPPPPPAPPSGEAPVAQQQAGATGLPTQIGQCVTTSIKSVANRLDDMPGSGSAVNLANGGYQVSYEQVPEVDASKPGDPARMCLVSPPEDCPAGDNRGIVYKTTDLRTGQSWTLPDSEHGCGGA